MLYLIPLALYLTAFAFGGLWGVGALFVLQFAAGLIYALCDAV